MRKMWDELTPDILSHIFSFLSPDSLAHCMPTCKHWRRTASLLTSSHDHQPPWLVVLPSRSPSLSSIITYSPSLRRWYSLPLAYLPPSLRLISSIPSLSLLLFKLTNSPSLRLLITNPFTSRYNLLPHLPSPLTNPAIAVVTTNTPYHFKILVAGGSCGGSYSNYLHLYDSRSHAWLPAASMPPEFAVRLTVWTPNDAVHSSDGSVYWMTSARAYSMVGYDFGSDGGWREVKVPMADQLEWAALVRRGNGRAAVVGGTDGGGFVWELRGGDEWALVGLVPPFHVNNKGSCSACGGGVKFVGGEDGVMYLLREDGQGKILVGSERGREIEWRWIVRCSGWWWTAASKLGSVKAVTMRPSLSPTSLLGE